VTESGESQAASQPAAGRPSGVSDQDRGQQQVKEENQQEPKEQGDEQHRTEPAAPPKDWPLWVWPAVAIALTAVAGYRLGIAGALTAAASAVAALVFVAGDFLYSGQRRRAFAIFAVSLAVIVLVVLLWQAKIPWVRLRVAAHTVAPGAVDLRGTTITRAQAARLNLRGAQLSGAVLDGLALRGKQMEGVTASGASFRHVDLSFASLRGADLNGADLSYACLIGTDLTGALLDGADVNHATLNVHVLPRSEVKTLTGVPVRPRAHQTKCPGR
jgi:Pentapeptide repeats (8 copies)